MKIVKITLSEDAELGAQTSKYILVFAFGYLSQLYSVISCIDLIAYTYMLDIMLTLVSILESY